MNLGEKQKAVLRRAVVDRESAKVTFQMAKSIYGDKHGTKKCLNSLKGKGILEEVHQGTVYKITNLPDELYEEWLS